MRKEPFSEGDVVHVIKRGSRGLDIFIDDSDKWQFIKALYILNDEYKDNDWRKNTANLPMFNRPDGWPERKPLARILAWVILPNHIHLLVQEVKSGGISKFMQRLGGSMTLSFNSKHKSQGSIFQGAYKAKRVGDDEYFKYVMFYVLIKNVFEQYPGGLRVALSEFKKAWDWAISNPFSSLRPCIIGSGSPILEDPERLIKGFVDSNNLSQSEVFEMLKEYVKRNEGKSDLP